MAAPQAPARYRMAYAGLFLFTLVLYARPNDLLPIGDFPIAKIIGVVALLAFLMDRHSSSHSVSEMPKEMKYLLGLLGTMFLSVPLSISSGEAINTIFEVYLKVVLVFMLAINVVTSRLRLRRLMGLTVLCGAGIAIGTLWRFDTGRHLVEGYRAAGIVGGMFVNPNDLALAMNMLLPLALGLALTSEALPSRLAYLTSGMTMAAAVYATYSRGGLLTLVFVGVYILGTMGRSKRMVAVLIIAVGLAIIFLGSPEYSSRMLSILDPSLDQSGSSTQRENLLSRSLRLASSNPKVVAVGIGAGTYDLLSDEGLGNHNAYLQVLTELGLPAFVLYLLFIRSAFKGVGVIVKSDGRDAALSHLAILGMAVRGSLLAYLVGSFFADVAYLWYLYYPVAYAVCLRRIWMAGVPTTQPGTRYRRENEIMVRTYESPSKRASRRDNPEGCVPKEIRP